VKTLREIHKKRKFSPIDRALPVLRCLLLGSPVLFDLFFFFRFMREREYGWAVFEAVFSVLTAYYVAAQVTLAGRELRRLRSPEGSPRE
jgi:hypothetical protein